jgi:hypothetical protein
VTLRSPNLEDLPRWQATHRDGRDHTWCSGCELGHRVYRRMVRFLRGQVGRHWTEALADLDRATRDWRVAPQLLRQQREHLRSRLFDGGRWSGARACDGYLRIDPQDGLLVFTQDSRKRRRHLPPSFDLTELRQEPELIPRG